MLPWTIRHAAWVVTRYNVRRDIRMTPYETRVPLFTFLDLERRETSQVNLSDDIGDVTARHVKHPPLLRLWKLRDRSCEERYVSHAHHVWQIMLAIHR